MLTAITGFCVMVARVTLLMFGWERSVNSVRQN